MHALALIAQGLALILGLFFLVGIFIGLALYAFKMEGHAQWGSQTPLHWDFTFRFLFWKWPYSGTNPKKMSEDILSDYGDVAATAAEAAPTQTSSQSGFLRLPRFKHIQSWLHNLASTLRRRFQQSVVLMVTDKHLMGQLLLYLIGSFIRALKYAGLHLENLRLGLSRPEALGKITGAWAALSASHPNILLPLESDFTQNRFFIEIRLRLKTHALKLLCLILVSVVIFPWRALARPLFKGLLLKHLPGWRGLLLRLLRGLTKRQSRPSVA